MTTINNALCGLLLVDSYMCNPQGNMNNDNAPNILPNNNHGFITAHGIKRNIRDRHENVHQNEPGQEIFCSCSANTRGVYINDLIDEARQDPSVVEIEKESKTQTELAKQAAAAKVLSTRFFDLRMFGGALSTGSFAKNLTGPVQFSPAVSIDPIQYINQPLCRCMLTNEPSKNEGSNFIKTTECGNYFFVPYALYAARFYVSPIQASKTGATMEDLELLMDDIKSMYWDRHTSSKGTRRVRGLWLFDLKQACDPDLVLDAIKVQKKAGVNIPSCWEDYEVKVSDPINKNGVVMRDLLKA
ncbi:MAG: type I CRISPR-associated protein Cas7 [Paludibacteraceae bacterium]|nr:type I CRISPR-associated protein Cas7 [Paludibacteraceae bacterium]